VHFEVGLLAARNGEVLLGVKCGERRERRFSFRRVGGCIAEDISSGINEKPDLDVIQVCNEKEWSNCRGVEPGAFRTIDRVGEKRAK